MRFGNIGDCDIGCGARQLLLPGAYIAFFKIRREGLFIVAKEKFRDFFLWQVRAHDDARLVPRL